MKFRTAPFLKRNRKSILLTFLLLLTLPVFVYSLVKNSSFDSRNKAFEDIQISESNPCIITFPNINPYSIEVNTTVRIQVDALLENSGIKSVEVRDSTSNILFTKEYTDSTTQITESFPFIALVPRAYNLTGKILDINNREYSCVISSPYDIRGVKAISSNTKPIFTSSPKDSIPSQSIQTGVSYEYTIEAEDVDEDTINYAYSFTEGESWLKPTIIEDGSGGKLTIKLKGSTNKAGSYLANIFIHDGYSTHLSSQSWVISVSPEDNNNPNIKIIEPVDPVNITIDPILKVTWEGEDDDQISRYEIYISSNPANQSSWEEINTNISPDLNSFNIDFTNIPDGTYRVIVRGIDNQTPPGIGMDTSQEIIVAQTPVIPDTPDDQVVLEEPQVINMSPTNADNISNTTPTIKASLISAQETSINIESINVKLDGKDISKDIQINEISENEATVIYLPKESLSLGLHKVDINFKDSNETSTQKSWTFTIQGEESEETNDNFNIFGFEVARRTTYIVMGGLGVILLAIFIPILIAALWKDNNNDNISTNSYAIPKSVPQSSEIPPLVQQQKDLKDLGQDTFQAPEPELEIPSLTNTLPPTPQAPEPEQDLQSLYNQIEELEKKEENPPK